MQIQIQIQIQLQIQMQIQIQIQLQIQIQIHVQQIHTSDSQHGNCKDVKLGEPSKLFLRCALNPTQLSNKHCFVNVLRTLCFTTLLKIASIQTDSSAQNKATSSEQL